MELKKFRIAPSVLLPVAILTLYSDIAVPFIVSVLAHELGHFIAIKAFSARIRCVTLYVGGVVIDYDNSSLSYGQDAVCAAAGPAVSLLLAAAAAACGRLTGNDDAYVLTGASAVLFIFNMLPVSVLDGGRILYLIISSIKNPIIAENIRIYADIVLSASLFVLFSYLTLCGKTNGTPLYISAVLLILCCKKAEYSVKL